ncbi:MerR family transcriptional regulator [Kibdelosporangium phytohabitans]|uniref:MerR family transcriptional regulator n=1 Tax=Kibdelosporangium phytohabitans TaxID=860235 RepID=A0A0N9IAU7_9PSEU|nr:MerR family transcriptional regulator [Kibdelosporangium phytohabitans]ALG11913.1 MerR family transcriptional regulator [Kibdelosporangium phytohabitans]MBE1463364.1 DNA-binding transcriptional MerR regulator [Kibdelosporangium phytohabitans]
MDAFTPIRVVAEHFAIPISTLHYWERRGLLSPHRRSGRRCYDTDQVYRIALIQLWRETGLMSIDEISAILTGQSTKDEWRTAVRDRVGAIEARIAKLGTAVTYLTHLLACPHGPDLEECPQFRARTPIPRDGRSHDGV